MTTKNTDGDQPSVLYLKTRGFWSKLHEVGKPLTLKEASDNLKNYAIAAAAYASGVKMIDNGIGIVVYAGYALATIAVVFCAITVCQSFVLTQKQITEIFPVTARDLSGNKSSATLKLLMNVIITLFLASNAIITSIWFAKNQLLAS